MVIESIMVSQSSEMGGRSPILPQVSVPVRRRLQVNTVMWQTWEMDDSQTSLQTLVDIVGVVNGAEDVLEAWTELVAGGGVGVTGLSLKC